MMHELQPKYEEFFDPFADHDEQKFDRIKTHQIMWQKYAANEVKHDYLADRFVADTQALILDAQFADKFEEAAMIAQRMHMLCGEDHGLARAASANETIQSLLDDHHDDHHHGTSDQLGAKDTSTRNEKRKTAMDSEEDEDEDDERDENSKKKRRKRFAGFLARLMRRRY